MMKRISKFRENALQDHADLPLTRGVDPEVQRQRWAKLCDKFRRNINGNIDPSMLLANPVGFAGQNTYDWHRIIDQFECEDRYLLVVEGFSLQLVKQRFGGYWVRANCAIAIIHMAKDYSESCWIAPHAYNWWWQRKHPIGPSMLEYQHPAAFKFEGVRDIQIETDNSLTFRWATRGMMRLRILPERKFGVSWAHYEGWMIYSLRNLSRSRLRLRRVPEWGWPTSRTFWGAWRRFCEMFIVGAAAP